MPAVTTAPQQAVRVALGKKLARFVAATPATRSCFTSPLRCLLQPRQGSSTPIRINPFSDRIKMHL